MQGYHHLRRILRVIQPKCRHCRLIFYSTFYYLRLRKKTVAYYTTFWFRAVGLCQYYCYLLRTQRPGAAILPTFCAALPSTSATTRTPPIHRQVNHCIVDDGVYILQHLVNLYLSKLLVTATPVFKWSLKPNLPRAGIAKLNQTLKIRIITIIIIIPNSSLIIHGVDVFYIIYYCAWYFSILSNTRNVLFLSLRTFFFFFFCVFVYMIFTRRIARRSSQAQKVFDRKCCLVIYFIL